MRILFYYICIFNVGKSVANSGSADVCADGQSSETGMAPGCSDNYPHVVLTPKVVTDLADGIQIRKFTTLEPVFKCVFDEMIDSLKLVFDIHWYINNDLVVVNMNIAQGKLFDTHMRPHHWTTTYSMNMQVKCSVRARLGPNETPSPFFESEEITAGVISDLHLNSFVEVTEGKAATIKLRSTVPVGCFSKNLQSQCNHTMHIRQISYNYNSNRCINNLQTGDLAIETEFCGITIPSIGWDNTLDLKVTGYVNNLYDEQKTRTATIHFTSLVRNNVDISGTWNRVDIPDLKVRITDADHKLSGRACLAFTLSNFVTIYGDEYSFQGAGEYVLYRHKTLPYSVHILQTAIKSSSTGICGIAVRSVNSIFVLRTCNTISQYFSNQNVLTVPVVQYKQCNDNDMTIQETGSGYKIHLPSGTEITFQYERYWIKSILVKPSVLDDGLVNGLCGNIANKESISTSWRVSNALQQLFIEKPQNQTALRPPQQYCTCKKEAGPTDDPSILKFEFVQCDLSQPIDVYSCQHPNQVNEYIIDECTLSRNRRSVVNRNIPTLDDIKEVIPLTYDSSFNPNYIPQEPSWPEMWSKYQAQVFCENYTSSMEIVRLCRQYSSFNVDTFTEGCMKDIKHGGNTNYVEWIVGVIKDYCFVELSRNATSMSRTTENGKTLYYELLYAFCPTGCRHWRNCVNGKCIECDSNDFIGHDCLALKSEPPKDIVLAGNGSCNTRQRPCLKTDIYGEFKSTLLYCKLSRFKITVNGIVQNETSNIWPGEYNSAHSISCQFPRQPRNRPTTELAVGYIISIAYDREHFGDNVSFVIYDGTCVTCDASTLTCNVVKPYEECMPTSSTGKPINQRTTHRSLGSSANISVISVVTFSVSLCLLSIFVPVILHLKRKRKSNRKNSNLETIANNGNLNNENMTYSSRRPTVVRKTVTFDCNLNNENMIYHIYPDEEIYAEAECPPPYSSRRPSLVSQTVTLDFY